VTAIQEVLPDAMQIADRFHLHQNLLEAIRNTVNFLLPVDIKIPQGTEDDSKPLTANNVEDTSCKKTTTIVDNFSELDEKRVQMYQTIHEYHAAGYSKREIAKILRCSRNTVTKNISGDFEALCKKDFRSGIDIHYDYIIKSLQAGMCRKDVYRNIISQGYIGKQTAAYDYMNSKRRIIQRSIKTISNY